MCNPAAWAAAAVVTSVIGTGVSYVQNKNAAEDAQEIQDRSAKLRIKENNQKASLDKLAKQRETLRREAAAQAGIADAGISGNSVLREFATLEIQGDHDEGIIEANRKNANEAATIQADASAASYAAQTAQNNGAMIGGIARAANYGAQSWAKSEVDDGTT